MALVVAGGSKSRVAILAKGVIIDENAVRDLCRDEACTRRSVVDLELSERQDTQFLIAFARSEFRRFASKPLPRTETKGTLQQLDILLFHPQSPPRAPKTTPEFRRAVITSRPDPNHVKQVLSDELELREWVVRLEKRLREQLAKTFFEDGKFIRRFVECENAETTARTALLAAEAEGIRSVLRGEFVERPPVRGYRASRPLTFDEQQSNFRLEIESAEENDRRAAHDWLCLMYGVRLFSVARIEDIFRCEIEDDFQLSFSRAIAGFFHVEYRCAALALCAGHSGGHHPLLHGVMLSTRAISNK